MYEQGRVWMPLWSLGFCEIGVREAALSMVFEHMGRKLSDFGALYNFQCGSWGMRQDGTHFPEARLYSSPCCKRHRIRLNVLVWSDTMNRDHALVKTRRVSHARENMRGEYDVTIKIQLQKRYADGSRNGNSCWNYEGELHWYRGSLPQMKIQTSKEHRVECLYMQKYRDHTWGKLWRFE